MFFRCTIAAGQVSHRWTDPEGIVTRRRYFTRADLDVGHVRCKPDSLARAAWGEAVLYDPLETIVR